MTKIRKYAVIFLAVLMALAAAPMAMADGGVAKIGTAEYETLSKALAAANANDTIVMLQDVSLDEQAVISKSVTLDLGGFTIKGNGTDAYPVVISGDKGGNVAKVFIKNGTIEGMKNASDGAGLKVAKKGNLTIEKDATIKGPGYGVVVQGTCVLNVYGTVETTSKDIIHSSGNGYAISGNGSNPGMWAGTEVNIYSGAKITGLFAGIYNPQVGKLNISGGTITGATAVEAKAGTVVISGGDFKATSETPQHAAFGNDGTSTEGYAVALVENVGYNTIKGNPSSVSISAGTFTGAIGYEKDSDNAAGNTYTYTITGGSYSSDPSAYVAEPYIVKQSGDTFTVGQIEDEVTVSPAKLELTVGKSSKVTATSDKMDTITWETSDSDVATVSDGTVTAAKTGIAIITAKGREHSASCVVSVIDPDKPASTPTPEPVSPGTVEKDKNPVNNDKDKPANVEATESTVFAATESTKESVAGEIKFDKEDLIANAEGDLTVSPILAKSAVEYVKSADSTVTPTSITVLPIVQAEVEKEGNVAAIALTLTGPELGAQSNSVAGDINLIKVFADGTGEKFGYVSAAADYADKTFTLKDADGKNLAPTDKVATDSVYTLILFVADNGDFDLDAKAGNVIDPVAVATNAATEPKSGSSSSGCNGGFGALALLGLALVPMFYGKKR